ncbi:hypothetical protein [Pseudomonas chlororaphis]|uniref:hypothetical protein n=1 Tax=Pseudomonas chlororaphis TaxID=587753 RepID=UPI0024082729|nr:hypothetical protein [Pseudomonas chlororaphis]
MCNAWNHPLNCTCGWGGEGHSGRSTFSDFVPAAQSWWPRALTSTYDSYVNPNASCPVCGAAVFFYQSPSGGRVFFDELGPPWPKHPCTDNTSRPGRLASAPSVSTEAASYTRQPSGWQPVVIESITGIDKDFHPRTDNASRPGQLASTPSASTEAASYAWQRSGWQPFPIETITGIDKDFLKITGILDHQRICLYIQRLVEHHLHTQAFSEKSLALVKANPDTSHQLSILLPHGVPITLTAFLLLADARRDLNQRIQAKKAQTSGAHSTVATQSSKRPSTLSRQPNRLTLPPPAKTTMALAFRKAQEKKDNT